MTCNKECNGGRECCIPDEDYEEDIIEIPLWVYVSICVSAIIVVDLLIIGFIYGR